MFPPRFRNTETCDFVLWARFELEIWQKKFRPVFIGIYSIQVRTLDRGMLFK